MQCAKCNGKSDVVDYRPQGGGRLAAAAVPGLRGALDHGGERQPERRGAPAVVDSLVNVARETTGTFLTLKKMKSRGGVG